MAIHDYQHYFSKTIAQHSEKIFLQAHSHHFWPDVAFQSMQKYATLVQQQLDDKWTTIFSELIPQVQQHIIRMLNFPTTFQIAFAPNTHELLLRLLSCWNWKSSPPLKIMTTNHEFHSARRQLDALHEQQYINLITINIDSLCVLETIESIDQNCTILQPQIVFMSQCFFDTGIYIPENLLISLSKKFPHIFWIIDGYHSFATRPHDWKESPSNLSFLAGGYKYAMSGEGVGFLALSHTFTKNPALTGWLAEFGNLASFDPSIKHHPTHHHSKVSYSKDYYRFLGATFDPIGLFRFDKVWSHWEKEKMTLEKIYDHVLSLQEHLLQNFASTLQPLLRKNILPQHRANFLSLDFKSTTKAHNAYLYLKNKNIFTDTRNTTLRIGFSLYNSFAQVENCAYTLQDYLKNNFL